MNRIIRTKFILKIDYTFNDIYLNKGTIVEYNLNIFGYHQILYRDKILAYWGDFEPKKIDNKYPDGLLKIFELSRQANLNILLNE